MVAYLDRINIGYAQLQMKQSLPFSDAVYGLGARIFFIGYFLFEVPTARLSQRNAHIENDADLPESACCQIEHFLAHYTDLEPGKWVNCDGWGDADEVRRLIVEGIARAK